VGLSGDVIQRIGSSLDRFGSIWYSLRSIPSIATQNLQNGTFIIDGKKSQDTFPNSSKTLQKRTQNRIASAYKRQCKLFVNGPKAQQIRTKNGLIKADFFETPRIDTVIFAWKLKPIISHHLWSHSWCSHCAGRRNPRSYGRRYCLNSFGWYSVYMTFPFFEICEGRSWEIQTLSQTWLYQTPMIFWSKLPMEPLILETNSVSHWSCGSVLTLKHAENGSSNGFSTKVIMLAAVWANTNAKITKKQELKVRWSIVIMVGDNYRIEWRGLGGFFIEYRRTSNAIESTPSSAPILEMQKRVSMWSEHGWKWRTTQSFPFTITAQAGHLNCLSEWWTTEHHPYWQTSNVGDPTFLPRNRRAMSLRSNGLVIAKKDVDTLHQNLDRESRTILCGGRDRTGDMHFNLENQKNWPKAVDWKLGLHVFGSSPKTVLEDQTACGFRGGNSILNWILGYIREVLQLEAVSLQGLCWPN